MVEAEFQDADGEQLSGLLWDVSSAGACLQLRHHVPIAGNTLGLLLMHAPFNSHYFSLPVQVCWSSPSRHSTFVGMVFAEGLLGPGTFLDDYMKASWVDRMETHKAQLI